MKGVVPYHNRVKHVEWFSGWDVCLVRTDKPLSKVWVYFMPTNCGYIKIGKSKAPDRRHRGLFLQSPPNVTLDRDMLVNESVITERELKIKFSEWYHPGEWYDEVEEVVGFVEQLRKLG